MATTRRRFLTSTTALAAGAWVVPRFAIGQSGPSANEKITNRPELNAWLRLPTREGWKYGETL